MFLTTNANRKTVSLLLDGRVQDVPLIAILDVFPMVFSHWQTQELLNACGRQTTDLFDYLRQDPRLSATEITIEHLQRAVTERSIDMTLRLLTYCLPWTRDVQAVFLELSNFSPDFLNAFYDRFLKEKGFHRPLPACSYTDSDTLAWYIERGLIQMDEVRDVIRQRHKHLIFWATLKGYIKLKEWIRELNVKTYYCSVLQFDNLYKIIHSAIRSNDTDIKCDILRYMHDHILEHVDDVFRQGEYKRFHVLLKKKVWIQKAVDLATKMEEEHFNGSVSCLKSCRICKRWKNKVAAALLQIIHDCPYQFIRDCKKKWDKSR